MATLEQILEEVRKLPTEEQRRLRDALDELSSNGDAEPSYKAVISDIQLLREPKK